MAAEMAAEMVAVIRSPGSAPVRAAETAEAGAVVAPVEADAVVETVEADAVAVIAEAEARASAAAVATVRAIPLLPPGRDEQQERGNPRYN